MSTFATDKDTSTLRHDTAVTTTVINDICIWHDRTTSAVVIQLGPNIMPSPGIWIRPPGTRTWRVAALMITYARGILQAWRMSQWHDLLLALTQLLLSCHLYHWNEVKQKLATFFNYWDRHWLTSGMKFFFGDGQYVTVICVKCCAANKAILRCIDVNVMTVLRVVCVCAQKIGSV